MIMTIFIVLISNHNTCIILHVLYLWHELDKMCKLIHVLFRTILLSLQRVAVVIMDQYSNYENTHYYRQQLTTSVK